MGKIKDFLGVGSDKGVDCQDDENGNKICRIMIRHKNNKFATGSEFQAHIEPNSCKATTFGRYSVFDEDEELVKRSLKKMETECRGGIN